MVHSYVNLVDREERDDEGEEEEDDDEEDGEEAEEVSDHTHGVATYCRFCFFFNKCHRLLWDVTNRGIFEFSGACVHLQYWLMLQRANVNRSDDRESQTRVRLLQILLQFCSFCMTLIVEGRTCNPGLH